MPLSAPHGHHYKAYDNFDFKYIDVFCTMRHKNFLYRDSKGLDITICSKNFKKDSCNTMFYKDFFESKVYMHSSIISDRKFHKNFASDTLIVKNNSTGKTLIFLPVID